MNAMTKTFKNKERSTGFQHGVMGTGSFAVTLNFLPDYLKAKFATQGTQGKQHDGKAAARDYLYWELAHVSATEYTFTVHYQALHTRDIQWVAAKLPKNAEIISH
jgi:hypothetical protein